MDGPAPLRHLVGSEEMVTIDSGPSWLHVVHDSASRHIEIAPSVEPIATELRRLQRHLDRQHRKGSPKCFDEKDRHLPGRCYWKKRSKSAKRRGPGAQLKRIEDATKRASGSYEEINSRLTLSQSCICGARVKNPLVNAAIGVRTVDWIWIGTCSRHS